MTKAFTFDAIVVELENPGSSMACIAQHLKNEPSARLLAEAAKAKLGLSPADLHIPAAKPKA